MCVEAHHPEAEVGVVVVAVTPADDLQVCLGADLVLDQGDSVCL